jgi:hypothetical protein
VLRRLLIKRAAEFLNFPFGFFRCGGHHDIILMENAVAAMFYPIAGKNR